MRTNRTTKFFAAVILMTLTLGFAGQAAETGAQKIDINKATAEELQALPGVGEVIAKRIVEYRNANGLFEKASDIMNVKGIGEKSYLKMKDSITVSEKPAVKK